VVFIINIAESNFRHTQAVIVAGARLISQPHTCPTAPRLWCSIRHTSGPPERHGTKRPWRGVLAACPRHCLQPCQGRVRVWVAGSPGPFSVPPARAPKQGTRDLAPVAMSVKVVLMVVDLRSVAGFLQPAPLVVASNARMMVAGQTVQSSDRSPDCLKMKNPACAAVKREATHGRHAAFDPDSARRLCCCRDRRRAFVSGGGIGL
jgi:hypothetical protein